MVAGVKQSDGAAPADGIHGGCRGPPERRGRTIGDGESTSGVGGVHRQDGECGGQEHG